MPVNRNALLRYKTIDNCLQNRYRRWTLKDLIEACSDALYEYEGIDKGVSRRTVQLDIQTMRSDKLGYNAPIIVVDKRYYTYEDPNYSITNSPLTEQDLNQLTDAVGLLKQFKSFTHFEQLNGMVQKLEDHIHAQKTRTRSVIQIEKNDDLKGLEYLDGLYKAIIEGRTVELEYQSFRARNSKQFVFHPYLLKEFNNRWFVIGRRADQAQLYNYALDRILQLQLSEVPYQIDPDFDPETYYQHTIGVSVSKQAPEKVELLINHRLAPYVLTKPIHQSQRLVKRDHYGVTVELLVQHNFELERILLGFGDALQVVSPNWLERKIRGQLEQAAEHYRTQVSERGIRSVPKRLKHKGWAIYHRIYTWRMVKHLLKHVQRLAQTEGEVLMQVPQILARYSSLANYLFSRNLVRLLQAISPEIQIVDSHWYARAEALSTTPWHQTNVLPLVPSSEQAPSLASEVLEALLKQTYTVYIVLEDNLHQIYQPQVLPGSNKRLFNEEERMLICENSSPYEPEWHLGTVLLLQGLTLHRQVRLQAIKKCPLIVLTVTAAAPPTGWTWSHATSLIPPA